MNSNTNVAFKVIMLLLFFLWASVLFYILFVKHLIVSSDLYDNYVVFSSNKSNGYRIAAFGFVNLISCIVLGVVYNKYRKKKTPTLLSILLLSGLVCGYSFYEVIAETMKKTIVDIYADKVMIRTEKPLHQTSVEVKLSNQKHQIDFFMEYVFARRLRENRKIIKDTLYNLVLITEKQDYVLLEKITHYQLLQHSKNLKKVIKNPETLPPPKGYTVKKDNNSIRVVKHAEGIKPMSIITIILAFLIGTGLSLGSLSRKDTPLGFKIFAAFIGLCSVVLPPLYVYESLKAEKELVISKQSITFTEKNSALSWVKSQNQTLHLSPSEGIRDMLLYTKKPISQSSSGSYYEYPILNIVTTGNQTMDINFFITESYTMYRADILRRYLIQECIAKGFYDIKT